MSRKLSFNEDPENYERFRPCYHPQLFEDIFLYAGKPANVLEIGCGTGKATEPFLRCGCKVTAIELGERLAQFTADKFSAYPNLHIINLPFEAYACENNTFDLLYSATAFHWIPADVGFPKAYALLRPGGCIALFWNKAYVSRKNEPLHAQIMQIYSKFLPGRTQEKHSDTISMLSDTGFCDIDSKLYTASRMFSCEEYVRLLNTYSDHHVMESGEKERFFGEIKDAVRNAGNIIELSDMMELFLARKP